MIRLKNFSDNDFYFSKMLISDLKFFNETRNEAAEWLHDPTKHSYDQCLKWFKNNKNSDYFIFKKGDTRIGYFRFSNISEKSLYIGADINKSHRGLGYAKIAYKSIIEHLKKENYNKIYLEVLSFNKRAINLYKKLGFEEVKRIEINRLNEKVISIKMEMKIYVE
jgi:RimJ/RimL family protein N-acetyltransferase